MINAFIRRLAVCICLAAATVAARAQCPTPPIRVHRDFINRTGQGSRSIALPPDMFTISNLLCLTNQFQRDYPDWRDVTVLFFSSDEAAESFDASGMSDEREVIDPATGRWLESVNIGRFRKELRALYVVDADERIRRLEITPLGLHTPENYGTTIALPAKQVHCRWELAKRCVLALSPLTFPDEATLGNGSGSVTLTGRVRRDGTITDLHVAQVTGESNGTKRSLIAATLDNLSTWWLEPRPHENAFRVTYQYIVDRSIPAKEPLVIFEPPARVVTRANPGP